MNWPLWVLLFFFIGLVLLLCELFIVPGFGPVGIAAIIFLTTGAYLAWTKLSMIFALTITFISILSVIGSIIYFKKSGLASKLVLNQNIEDDISSDKENLKKTDSVSVGQIGYTQSDIRPTGIAEFQNQRVNVITDGIYIKRNTKVKIILIQGNKIFIEEDI